MTSTPLEVNPGEMPPAELDAYIKAGAELALGSELSGDERRDALIAAVAAHIDLIASGSFDKYVQRIAERKGAAPFDLADPVAVDEARRMFKVSASPTAGKRFSMSSMIARKHETAFAWSPTADEATMVVTAHRSRYPLKGLDDETRPDACYEFVLPIEHEFRKESQTLALGIRFIWSPASGTWIPVSLARYGGSSADTVVLPPL